MSDWLKRLLGVNEADIPEGATTSFEFANLPRGSAGLLLTLAAVGLIAGVFWVYRREGSASPRVKMGLAALRALVLATAFLLILEPVLAVDQIEEIDKSTVVLIDTSLSMTTKDRYVDPVVRAKLQTALAIEPGRVLRYQIVEKALTESGLIGLLSKQNKVIVYNFHQGLEPPQVFERAEDGRMSAVRVPIDLTTKEAKKAGALGTNLAGAIRQAVEDVGSDRIAAMIVISDGRANLGPPAADVALFLRNKDLRLHAVVVGEAETPRNLRVIALAGPDRIFRNDPASFEAQVSGQGYSGATVLFERRYADGSTDWQQVGSQVVAFQADKPLPLTFIDRPPRIGTAEYRVRMETEPDESNAKDNVKTFTTTVVDEKAKVLLISGAPAHEYYAIKNTLMRDTTITLAAYLQNADPDFPQDGNVSLKKLPQTKKEIFEYDVIILHDPNGEKLTPDWPALLKKFVSEHRGGLCYIAGNKFTLDLVRSNKAEEENDLTGILPVVLDLDRADMPGIGVGYGAYFDQPWRMVPDSAALIHPATRFGDPARVRTLVWERLPALYWFFPALRAKPGATVLARTDDPREIVEPYGARPILAVQRYGGGRVMFLAADETHRWMSVAEDIFDRFWVQSTRYLLEGRQAGARRRFRVYLDRELVDFGSAVRLHAEIYDDDFEPLDLDSVEVEIRGPLATDGGETPTTEFALQKIEGKPGQFTASFAPSAEGDFEIRAADKRYRHKTKEGLDSPAATFRAELPDREMGDVRADKSVMRDLAARTRGIAPGVFELERLADPDLIPPATERVVTQGKPIPLWDTWTTILVILSLVCAEWILRKVYRMV
ncbi:MAG: hypothetical protein OER88_02070 [Planctomycetota bacterium]|nr:hypothetical protein [Planctomycetota bacterium]